MSRNDDDRGAAAKVLEVLEALSGYAVSGVSNTALARLLAMSAPNVTRAIGVLVDKGWARKDEATGHFHPTPRMGHAPEEPPPPMRPPPPTPPPPNPLPRR